MKKQNQYDFPAVEQSGLPDELAYEFNINRRRFFQVMGSGLAVDQYNDGQAYRNYNSQ